MIGERERKPTEKELKKKKAKVDVR